MTQPNIVILNVSQTTPPAPSTLQRTGALVTQGGTNLAAGSTSLLTQKSDLTPLLPTAAAISSAAWLTGVVTITTTNPHGLANGSTVSLTIAGFTPTGYNGTFTCTVTGANTFTYPLTTNPGAATVQGTWVPYASIMLQQMANTFFAQGSNTSVYVLELGAGTTAQGVTALAAYDTANPNQFYSYLVPRGWDAEPTYVQLMATYTGLTAKKYFFTTVTLSTYSSFVTNGTSTPLKCVFMMIEAPAVTSNVSSPLTEFTLASVFQRTLNYNPSPSNQVTPLCFSYLTGVTVYPATGPQAAAFKTNNVNYVVTGAEGGISNTMLVWGHMCDGNPFNYWYSVDWTQINLELDISNEIINGSNNPLAPLYYNQQGINRLQVRAQKTFTRGIAYGLVLGNVTASQLSGADFATALGNGAYAGQCAVNAIPFANYNSLNPSDYAIGKYAGLAAVYTPLRGFEQIVFNLNVTNFVA
jgi:hypothetical protein